MGLLSSDVEKIEIKFDQVEFGKINTVNNSLFSGWQALSCWRCCFRDNNSYIQERCEGLGLQIFHIIM